MKLENIPTTKLAKVEKALKTLLESDNRNKPEVRKAIKKLSSTRNVLKEATLATATVNQKDPRKEDSVLSVDPTSQSTLNTLKSMKNTADVTLAGRKLEEQGGRGYSAEESQAVGEALEDFIVAATRGTKGEIGEKPTVTGERNKVSIRLVYGHDKGEDTFHFDLKAPDETAELPSTDNPVAGIITMNINGKQEEVVQFEVTEANEVKFNPEVNLEDKLKELLVKYTEASIKEPQTSPDNIDNFIAERKQALRESFGQSNVDEDKRGTFTIKGLGTFNNLGVDGDVVKGSQNNGPVRTFTKKRVMDDNPDFFKPAPRAPRVPKMTEKQYWNLLQGAVDDAGTNVYAHDMAESMILDDSLVRFLKSEYPELRTPEDFLERLQWDLEACEPEGNDAYGYDDDEDEIVPEGVSTTFKVGDKVTYLGAPGEITAVRDYAGKQYVSVAYNKGQGRTKVSGVLSTNGDVEHATVKETTKHVGDKYVNYPEHGGKRLGTFDSKSAAQKQLAAIEINKSVDEDFDIGHEDDEPNMLKAELYKMIVASTQLYKMLSAYEGKGEIDFPQWWQAKIIQAADNVKSAKDYLEFENIQPQLDVAINTLG